ncbi:MAG: DUF1328 domain-containing protein [Flavobacteriales bacterium]|nr:DUF1328 domain-containing protein [Flavobacteriales bacterium]
MIRWIITFLMLALISAILGFSVLAAGAAVLAKVIFYIFLLLLALTVIFGNRIWPNK